MSEPTINSATCLKILRQTYTDDVLNTVIPKNVDIRDAHFKQQDIFAYSPAVQERPGLRQPDHGDLRRMSKQRPNPDKLANELAGASAFFRQSRRSPSRKHPIRLTPAAPVNPEPANQSDVMTSRRHSVTTSGETPRTHAGFDINRPTASRDSLRLSTDETKALDELRAALKWDYDLSVSKNDICRAALHRLLEDFQPRAKNSGRRAASSARSAGR